MRRLRENVPTPNFRFRPSGGVLDLDSVLQLLRLRAPGRFEVDAKWRPLDHVEWLVLALFQCGTCFAPKKGISNSVKFFLLHYALGYWTHLVFKWSDI